MELKPGEVMQQIFGRQGLNRTFMELKQGFDNRQDYWKSS